MGSDERPLLTPQEAVALLQEHPPDKQLRAFMGALQQHRDNRHGALHAMVLRLRRAVGQGAHALLTLELDLFSALDGWSAQDLTALSSQASTELAECGTHGQHLLRRIRELQELQALKEQGPLSEGDVAALRLLLTPLRSPLLSLPGTPAWEGPSNDLPDAPALQALAGTLPQLAPTLHAAVGAQLELLADLRT